VLTGAAKALYNYVLVPFYDYILKPLYDYIIEPLVVGAYHLAVDIKNIASDVVSGMMNFGGWGKDGEGGPPQPTAQKVETESDKKNKEVAAVQAAKEAGSSAAVQQAPQVVTSEVSKNNSLKLHLFTDDELSERVEKGRESLENIDWLNPDLKRWIDRKVLAPAEKAANIVDSLIHYEIPIPEASGDPGQITIKVDPNIDNFNWKDPNILDVNFDVFVVYEYKF